MARKFKKSATQYKLTWGDGDYEGLEVMMRSLPIHQFLEFTEMASQVAENPQLQAKYTRMTFTTFASALISWNLTDEFDEDVPATLNGVMTQELGFIFMIFTEWQKQMGGVSDPLPRASVAGERSVEASIPMDLS